VLHSLKIIIEIYLSKLFLLAIHASVRLHNWIMNTEGLSYSANESPKVYFHKYFLSQFNHYLMLASYIYFCSLTTNIRFVLHWLYQFITIRLMVMLTFNRMCLGLKIYVRKVEKAVTNCIFYPYFNRQKIQHSS
jgi:hypothetical protein